MRTRANDPDGELDPVWRTPNMPHGGRCPQWADERCRRTRPSTSDRWSIWCGRERGLGNVVVGFVGGNSIPLVIYHSIDFLGNIESIKMWSIWDRMASVSDFDVTRLIRNYVTHGWIFSPVGLGLDMWVTNRPVTKPEPDMVALLSPCSPHLDRTQDGVLSRR